MKALPIDPFLPEVLQRLEEGRSLVLQATPGSGKTTRVPPALLRARFALGGREIWVLEPRRLAAKWAARRVAAEMKEEVGRTVGYHFRFESVAGPQTRLRFLTEGMLMRRIVGDPTLKRVAAVVLDEFHERHLQGDIALAYLKMLQNGIRPDLRIVVMSATLDSGAVAQFLDGCPVVNVEARQFPVEVEYLPSPPSKFLDALVADAVARMPSKSSALVFLPGMADILRCADALRGVARTRGIEVHPLHGDLSREEQDRAIQSAVQPKVILATNIAETSLTIEGIDVVIDSGLHRQSSYSWWSGMSALKTRPISRASGVQRAGRAGRLGPGRCLRLYTRGDFDGRAPFETPEIRRADLSEILLEVKNLGVESVSEFPWFEAPSSQALQSAVELLFSLGALERAQLDSRLTPIGRRMAQIPSHPRLARYLIEAERRFCLPEAATLAAWIAEGQLETLDALEMLHRPLSERLRKVRRQLLAAFSGQAGDGSEGGRAEERERRLARSLLTGFPDRVAKIRPHHAGAARAQTGKVEMVFSAGGTSQIEQTAFVAHHETFLVLDVQERQFQNQLKAEMKVRSLCAVDPDWLLEVEPSALVETDEFIWSERRQKVVRANRLSYGALILVESEELVDPNDPRAAVAISALVLKSIFGVSVERAATLTLLDWVDVLGKVFDREQVESTFGRLLLFLKQEQNPQVAQLEGGGAVFSVLPSIFLGKSKLEELRAIDFAVAFTEQAEVFFQSPGLSAKISKACPWGYSLSSGRRLKIWYPLGKSPWTESRLQDFFGMKKGPSILNGSLPLVLHLLAPNQRAVQVTNDLSGFWARSYQEIRNELRRRYPKHSWPEDPLTAEPPRPRAPGQR